MKYRPLEKNIVNSDKCSANGKLILQFTIYYNTIGESIGARFNNI